MALFAVGMLVACEPSHKVAADGYYFEKAQFTTLTPNVQIVLVKTHAEMAALVKQHNPNVVKPGNEVMAFSVLGEHYGQEVKCTIYMIDPQVAYAPEFIGHELTHCLYGNWHTIQP